MHRGVESNQRLDASTPNHPKPPPIAAAFRLPLFPFLVLCLVTGVSPYLEHLVAAARELNIHPTVVVSIVLAVAALFHMAILSVHIFLARRPAEDEPKLRPRPAATTSAPAAPESRPPLLPFLVLMLAIAAAAAAAAGPVLAAAEAIHLPPNATVWACLALAASFHVAIGSIYFFVVNRPPPAVVGAEPRSRSEAAGAIIASAAAVGVISCLLVAGRAASGARSARI